MAFLCRTVSEEDLDLIYALDEVKEILPFLEKREYRTPIERNCSIFIDSERHIMLLNLPMLHRDDHWGKRLFVVDNKIVIFNSGTDYEILYLSPPLIPVFDTIPPLIREALEHAIAYAYIGKNRGLPITQDDKIGIANGEFIHPELDNLKPINEDKAKAINWIFAYAFPEQTPIHQATYRDIRNAEKNFYHFLLSTVREGMLKDATQRLLKSPDLNRMERIAIKQLHQIEKKLISEKLPRTKEKEDFGNRILFAHRGNNAPLLRSLAESIPSKVANRKELKRHLLASANLLDMKSKGIDTRKYEWKPGLIFMSTINLLWNETKRYENLEKKKNHLKNKIDAFAANYIERQFYELFTHPETRRIKSKLSEEEEDTRQDEQEMLRGRWYIYSDQIISFDGENVNTAEDKSPFLIGEETSTKNPSHTYRIVKSNNHGIIFNLTINSPAKAMFKNLFKRTDSHEIYRQFFVYFADGYKQATVVRKRATTLWKM